MKIVNVLTSLIPGKNKKNNGYYMQLDEAAEAKPKEAVKEKVTKKPEPTNLEPINGAKPAEPVAAPSESAQPTPAVQPTTAVSPKKVPTSKKAKASKTPAVEPAKLEASENGKAAKLEPVKPTETAAAIKQLPTETTFAPNYLIPKSSNGRRRPGPNMDSFLEMARNVKTSK